MSANSTVPLMNPTSYRFPKTLNFGGLGGGVRAWLHENDFERVPGRTLLYKHKIVPHVYAFYREFTGSEEQLGFGATPAGPFNANHPDRIMVYEGLRTQETV